MQIDLHMLREMRLISDEAALLHEAANELRSRVRAITSDDLEVVTEMALELVDIEDIDFLDVADGIAKHNACIKISGFKKRRGEDCGE